MSLTNGQIEQIKALRKQGAKVKDIAKLFSMSQSHISNIIGGKRGVRNESKLDEHDILSIFKMREEGVNLSTIGEAFGINSSVVSKILNGNLYTHISKGLGLIQKDETKEVKVSILNHLSREVSSDKLEQILKILEG